MQGKESVFSVSSFVGSTRRAEAFIVFGLSLSFNPEGTLPAGVVPFGIVAGRDEGERSPDF